MLSGNKGEWSEIYALFKLLSDTQLYAGDEHLNKIDSLFYPIVKILRNENDKALEYLIHGNVVIISGGDEEIRVPVKTFTEEATKVLEKIKNSSGAFSLPDTEAFMNAILCKTLKAKATSKTDIRIVIHDQRINREADLGFSIKSKLGGKATLLNAGKTTNFIYELSGFSPSPAEIDSINNIDTTSKIKDRIQAIRRAGGTLNFIDTQEKIFKNNLVLIDSLLPDIIAEVIKSFFNSNLSSIKDLTNEITRTNPLNYDNQFAHRFYEYKIKRFLTDVALGMMPSKVWSGIYEATGGYLVVKENGDVLCYHIYNQNQFEDYLFANTKLETASSTRHEFGLISQEGGKFYFKLNLQIRFK